MRSTYQIKPLPPPCTHTHTHTHTLTHTHIHTHTHTHTRQTVFSTTQTFFQSLIKQHQQTSTLKAQTDPHIDQRKLQKAFNVSFHSRQNHLRPLFVFFSVKPKAAASQIGSNTGEGKMQWGPRGWWENQYKLSTLRREWSSSQSGSALSLSILNEDYLAVLGRCCRQEVNRWILQGIWPMLLPTIHNGVYVLYWDQYIFQFDWKKLY